MTGARIRLAAMLVGLAIARLATAHEVRPGYLELREVAPERVTTLWKVPARGDLRFGIRVNWPASCSVVGESHEMWTGDAYVERGTLQCPGGLDGARIEIGGLAATVIDVLVRVERADGSAQTARLTPDAPAFVVAPAPGFLGVARAYVALGIGHILFGLDHVLFVLALVLLVGGTPRLIATATAFTVAHSLTLAAAALGFVHVPSRPVEAVIALSIVFVAVEILHGAAGRPGITTRRPWLVAFVFGLLHGLGFAGALTEVGLPPHAILPALLSFNVGVEIAQLAAIATFLTAGAFVARLRGFYPTWIRYLPPYAIGAVAAYWTIERLVRL